MVKVVGKWELAWNTPIKEYDLWAFPMRDFGIDEWCMCPISGIKKDKLTEMPRVQDFIDANPDLTPVYVDEDGDINLADFQHPEDALYVLGKAGSSAKSKNGLNVSIETPIGHGLLWPHQAICIVLYDRIKKQWQ